MDRPVARWDLEVLKTDKHLAANEKLITSTGVEKEAPLKEKESNASPPTDIVNIPHSRRRLIRAFKVSQLKKKRVKRLLFGAVRECSLKFQPILLVICLFCVFVFRNLFKGMFRPNPSRRAARGTGGPQTEMSHWSNLAVQS